jgi:cell filamentation protein
MSADPYFIPGGTVLRNRLGLEDSEALARAERLLSDRRAAQGWPEGELDFAHLKAIHRHLFQDIYDWAGLPRRCDLWKGSAMFARADHIEGAAATVFGDLAGRNHLRGLSFGPMAAGLAWTYGEINALHPFREGNGRAARALLGIVAERAGWRIDWTKTEPLGWIEASRASLRGDYDPLTDIFRRAITPLAPAPRP